MIIKPTQTWLREHPPMKLCPWKDTGCHCVFTLIDEDKHNTGFCIGLVPETADLDMVRICGNQPEEDSASENIFRVLAQVTPIEAAWLSAYIQIALSNVFQLDPDYRKKMGGMRSRKTHILNRKREKGDKPWQ